jgi:hypothetical protein
VLLDLWGLEPRVFVYAGTVACQSQVGALTGKAKVPTASVDAVSTVVATVSKTKVPVVEVDALSGVASPLVTTKAPAAVVPASSGVAASSQFVPVPVEQPEPLRLLFAVGYPNAVLYQADRAEIHTSHLGVSAAVSFSRAPATGVIVQRPTVRAAVTRADLADFLVELGYLRALAVQLKQEDDELLDLLELVA